MHTLADVDCSSTRAECLINSILAYTQRKLKSYALENLYMSFLDFITTKIITLLFLNFLLWLVCSVTFQNQGYAIHHFKSFYQNF